MENNWHRTKSFLHTNGGSGEQMIVFHSEASFDDDMFNSFVPC